MYKYVYYWPFWAIIIEFRHLYCCNSYIYTIIYTIIQFIQLYQNMQRMPHMHYLKETTDEEQNSSPSLLSCNSIPAWANKDNLFYSSKQHIDTSDIYVTCAKERQLPWEHQSQHSYSFNTSYWLHKWHNIDRRYRGGHKTTCTSTWDTTWGHIQS